MQTQRLAFPGSFGAHRRSLEVEEGLHR
jgi:hypothetical protein